MTTINPSHILNKELVSNGMFKIQYTPGLLNRLYNGSDVYIGALDENGIFDGYGEYIRNMDGIQNYYRGGFKSGMKHGDCEEKYWNTLFTGTYQFGKREGSGTEIYLNGDCVQFTFVNGNRHGSSMQKLNGSAEWKHFNNYKNGEIIR